MISQTETKQFNFQLHSPFSFLWTSLPFTTIRTFESLLIYLVCIINCVSKLHVSSVSFPPTDTLGARDFSSAVSGFCQVFIVTRAKSGFAARGFGLRPKTCRPSANTETSRRTRENPLVPRVSHRGI